MSATEGTGDAGRSALHPLHRLVGTWVVDGPDSAGTVRYQWMDGHAFLVQQVDLRTRRPTHPH